MTLEARWRDPLRLLNLPLKKHRLAREPLLVFKPSRLRLRG